MSNQDPPLELLGHHFMNDVRDIWTIPIAGLVAGALGFAFASRPCASPASTSRSRRSRSPSTPAIIRKFEEFTGGGTGINIFEVDTLAADQETTDPIAFETVTKPIEILWFEIPTFNSGSTT